jgi:hypothetical protein
MTDVISKCRIVICDLRQPWLNNRRVAELKAAFECQRYHHFVFANTHYVPYEKSVKHTDELAAEVVTVHSGPSEEDGSIMWG